MIEDPEDIAEQVANATNKLTVTTPDKPKAAAQATKRKPASTDGDNDVTEILDSDDEDNGPTQSKRTRK